MRVRVLLLALLSFPPLAFAASDPAPAPLDAVGPDAEGAFLLAYRVERASAGSVALWLHVRREDGAGVAESSRDLGARELPAGASRLNVSFLPAEGAGAYEVSLVAADVRGAPLRFNASEGGGGSARFAFEVADEPTRLELTADPVNADGKAKSPGEAVVTRARLRDGNGVADVDGGVRWRLDSPDGSFAEGAAAVTAWANATGADVEARLARSPLAAGLHHLTLIAVKEGRGVAQATRTFLVRDAAPLLVGGNLTRAYAGSAAALETEAIVADRNGVPGPLEARAYRGSARAEPQGFSVLLGAPARRADADGHGRVALPLRVEVPANATPGAYRVSLYADGALVGSLPFEVQEASARIPLRLVARHVTPRLPASWSVEAPGWDLGLGNASVEVRRWDGAPAEGVEARLEAGVLRVRGPPGLEAGRYDARLRLALPNGSEGEAAWSFEAGPWMSVALGEPAVAGREARVPVRNDGGVAVRRLVAEVAPDVAQATLVVGGVAHEARGSAGGRRVFAGVDLPPGASAELVLRLPEGPLPAGAHAAKVRVLALPGGG